MDIVRSAGIPEYKLLFFFCNAMQSGSFLSDKRPEEGPFPRWKKDTFSQDDLSLIDIWGPHPTNDNQSQGLTQMFYHGIAFWQMNYEGHYSEEALPFLKEVLNRTYGWGIMKGCRGIEFASPELCYVNDCLINSFSKFSGKEQIWRKGTSIILGEHTYSGGYLR